MQTDTPNSIDITDVLKIAIYRGENADGYARIGVVDAERALNEITRLRKELGAAREALADFDKVAADTGACGDGYCLVMGRARGMHTNGGCRCHTDQHIAHRMMFAGRRLRDDISAALGEGQK